MKIFFYFKKSITFALATVSKIGINKIDEESNGNVVKIGNSSRCCKFRSKYFELGFGTLCHCFVTKMKREGVKTETSQKTCRCKQKIVPLRRMGGYLTLIFSDSIFYFPQECQLIIDN